MEGYHRRYEIGWFLARIKLIADERNSRKKVKVMKKEKGINHQETTCVSCVVLG